MKEIFTALPNYFFQLIGEMTVMIALIVAGYVLAFCVSGIIVYTSKCLNICKCVLQVFGCNCALFWVVFKCVFDCFIVRGVVSSDTLRYHYSLYPHALLKSWVCNVTVWLILHFRLRNIKAAR